MRSRSAGTEPAIEIVYGPSDGKETQPREGSAIEVSQQRDFSDWIQGELDDLRRVRDELNVQSHLAKAELRDAWAGLEEGLVDLERRAKSVARAAEPVLEQLESDARKLVDDLRQGYRRIRDAV